MCFGLNEINYNKIFNKFAEFHNNINMIKIYKSNCVTLKFINELDCN